MATATQYGIDLAEIDKQAMAAAQEETKIKDDKKFRDLKGEYQTGVDEGMDQAGLDAIAGKMAFTKPDEAKKVFSTLWGMEDREYQMTMRHNEQLAQELGYIVGEMEKGDEAGTRNAIQYVLENSDNPDVKEILQDPNPSAIKATFMKALEIGEVAKLHEGERKAKRDEKTATTKHSRDMEKQKLINEGKVKPGTGTTSKATGSILKNSANYLTKNAEDIFGEVTEIKPDGDKATEFAAEVEQLMNEENISEIQALKKVGDKWKKKNRKSQDFSTKNGGNTYRFVQE